MRKIFALFVIIIMFFTSCAIDKQEEYPFYSPDMDMYEIKTDYCNLYYPEVWKDSTLVTYDRGKSHNVKFSAQLDETSVPLFSINFGGSQGEKLGTLNIENEQIDVLIETYVLNEENYSTDEIKLLRGMSEDVNVIISKLIEMYDLKLV